MRISDWSSDVCSSDLYKANRKASRKPLCYWTIIDHLRAEGSYRVLSEDCLEGDDYIGILATRTSPMYRVIVSEDNPPPPLPPPPTSPPPPTPPPPPHTTPTPSSRPRPRPPPPPPPPPPP